MRYASVCSGIEAATTAWHPLGWKPAWFSEIEPFPSAVLAHHYPDTPNLGDMTKINAKDYRGTIDLLVGGTPCQSFSVAGLRKGLADPRGNLALEFLRLADGLGARWVVWENVPGVLSSNEGRDFGAFLGGLEELGYRCVYRVLDAQYFGVPQRRRRVFVVGYLGDWRPAAAVLLEPEGMRGDSPPSRKAGQDVTGTLSARTEGGGGLGTDFDLGGGLIPEISRCLTSRSSRIDGETETFIAHTLRGEGFDASEDGPGRGTPLVPVAFDTTQITSAENRSCPMPGDPCHPLAALAAPPAITFNARQDPDAWIERSGPLDTCGSTQVVGTDLYNGAITGDVAATLGTPGSSSNASGPTLMQGAAVRRLTPRECERLQGFPDDFTLVPYRGRPASDGPRYKACGNSMAVPVMAWIGRRIEMVEQLRRRTTQKEKTQ